MKLNHRQNKVRPLGITLIELTIVILVLLLLTSILFVGSRAWKKGADRTLNIINIRNCQQAMRSHENMNHLNQGNPFVKTDLEKYIKFPQNVGSVVTYKAGTEITPQSADPAIDYAHIWLVPSASGLPTKDYGQNSFADSSGW